LVRQLGLDGTGTRVGVISDGASDLAAAQASGDLPLDVVVYGACQIRNDDKTLCLRGSTCNEGTAMLEIIHDIAPGAKLAVGAVGTSLEFITRVSDLVNDFRADIIVDDLGFLTEPMFADGEVAQAVAAVVDDVVFISAAGNDAEGHYEADYHLKSVDIVGLPFNAHNFGASDHSMNVTVEPDDYLLVFMQWNDPFGSSANDYDLWLFTADETDLLCDFCLSTFTQDGNPLTDEFGAPLEEGDPPLPDDPWEALCYYNDTGAAVTGKLIVDRYMGVSRRLEIFLIGPGEPVDEYNDPEGSIYGHPAVAGVIAVGAVNSLDPGNDTIASYSSRGPARIDFPTMQTRQKPDIISVDGVSVTGAGGFPGTFFGTSAAAPHVAGIAALLLQANPAQTPAMIRTALSSKAVDLGTTGFDSIYGHGRADALASYNGLDFDLDNDGLPDAFELTNGLDPENGSDALADADSDGLSNLQEFQFGTNLRSADTDGDGLADGAEIAAGRDPVRNEPAALVTILQLLLHE
jgi:subtilisin family serine protease